MAGAKPLTKERYGRREMYRARDSSRKPSSGTDMAVNEEMRQDVDCSGFIGQMADMVQMTMHTGLVGLI